MAEKKPSSMVIHLDEAEIVRYLSDRDRGRLLLALIDYALRRRFAFFEMRPGFDSEVFQKYQE